MHDMERGGIEIVNIITDARADTEIISFNPARIPTSNQPRQPARHERRKSRPNPRKKNRRGSGGGGVER